MISDKLKKFIDSGYKEYEDCDGGVTIETAVKRSDINDIFEYINSQPFGAYWYAMECETCQEYHGNEYVHLSIEDEQYVHEFCSNLIRKSK